MHWFVAIFNPTIIIASSSQTLKNYFNTIKECGNPPKRGRRYKRRFKQ